MIGGDLAGTQRSDMVLGQQALDLKAPVITDQAVRAAGSAEVVTDAQAYLIDLSVGLQLVPCPG